MENDEAERNELRNDGGEESIDFAALGTQALRLIQQQATEHPLRTVGIAMGVGYVLGGGIPKIVVRLGMLAAGKAVSQAATIEGARALAGLLQARGEDEGETTEDVGDDASVGADAAPTGQARRNGHRRRRNQQARAAGQA